MVNSPDSGVPQYQVLVEEADRGLHRSKLLPLLSPADTAMLTAFLDSAYSEPGRWHRLPESDLVFRMTSGHGEPDSFHFEIRDDRFPDEIRCYHYDRERSVLSCRTDHTVELLDLSHDHRLPHDTDEFAPGVLAGLSKLIRSTG